MWKVAKYVGELALARLGPAAVVRGRMRHRSLILAYHNIVPDGEAPGGDVAVHLPAASFREELDLLGELAEVVPLENVLSGTEGRGSRPRVAITFDDAYVGALTVGLALLREREMPATIFVAPQFTDGRGFWWDEVADPERRAGLGERLRATALTQHNGEDALIRAWLLAGGGSGTHAPQHARCASAELLAGALEHPGITLGSHSWSHPNLTRLDPVRLEEELTRPLQWLAQFPGRFLPVVAYPYGLTSPMVERAAAAAGYRAGLMVRGGWCPRRLESPFSVPRLNIPAGLSTPGFELRLAGILAG